MQDNQAPKLVFYKSDHTSTGPLGLPVRILKVYLKPSIVNIDNRSILYFPQTRNGTGDENESEYYLRNGSDWDKIDSKSWLVDLVKRMPKLSGVDNKIWIDLKEMKAEVSLYEDGDPSCCPSGPKVTVYLSLDKKKFNIKNITVQANSK